MNQQLRVNQRKLYARQRRDTLRIEDYARIIPLIGKSQRRFSNATESRVADPLRESAVRARPYIGSGAKGQGERKE